MDRREFLRDALMLGAGSVLMMGPKAWAARGIDAGGSGGRMVVIFLRGAVDGLSVVVPHGDSTYYDHRPNIAITSGQVLDLDGHFGLNPALAPLMPLWHERSLAFVDACGSPDPTRSHFDAQDYMESGTPGVKTTADGWMNRLLAALPRPHSSTEAINVGPTAPRILSGPATVANMPSGQIATRPIPLDQPVIETAFARLYQRNDALSRAFQEGYAAHRKLLAEIRQDMTAADNGAPQPNRAFAEDASRLGRLMKRDSSVRLAFMALGGWDTHVNQGSVNGYLANHLAPLSDGLIALARGLGDTYSNTVIVVMSEFGRTVHENGNGGTDHGHANVMWLMGGRVRGGKVYGNWPGLDEASLYQARDLAVTTDFRTVLWTAIQGHLNVDASAHAKIFPGFAAGPSTLPGLLQA